MEKIEMKKEGSGYAYDNCVFYMAKDWLNRYEYSTLLVLTNKLGEVMLDQAEKTAEKRQKESLKHLIKEAIKEARQEEKLQIRPKKKRKSK